MLLKYSFFRYTFIIVISIFNICLLSNCKQNNLKQLLLPQISDAYNNEDWDTTMRLIDSLINNNLSVDDLILAYSQALAHKGYLDKSIKILEDQLIVEPDNYLMYCLLGNIYSVKEDFDNAITSFNKSLELKPTYARPAIYLAKVYEKLLDTTKAIENYAYAIEVLNEHDIIDDVKQLSSDALNLDSGNIKIMNLLSDAYCKEGNYDKANIFLSYILIDEMENNDDNYILTANKLGKVLYVLNEYDNAIEILDLSIKSSNSEIVWESYCYIASAYNLIGDENHYKKYRDLAFNLNTFKTDSYIQEILGE